MPQSPNFELTAAHKYFSAECFNRAWDLIEKPLRTADDDEKMLLLSMASLWHWTQRPDRTPSNLSVGYWQVSRIYALLGQPDNAHRYAQLCLNTCQGNNIEPFYLGYAYEALARAEMIAGDRENMKEYLRKAAQVLEEMSDPEAKKQLQEDLSTIR
jgi:tetratricopeptide (TPR) repeat protein